MPTRPFIDPHSIARSQTRSDASLPETCVVTRRGVPVEDGFGGRAQAAQSVTTVFTGACLVSVLLKRLGAFDVTDAALVSSSSYVIAFPHDANVLPLDTVTVAGKGVFIVEGVMSGPSYLVRLVVRATLQQGVA